MKEKGPRCNRETFELRTSVIKIDKTREMRVLYENALNALWLSMRE